MATNARTAKATFRVIEPHHIRVYDSHSRQGSGPSRKCQLLRNHDFAQNGWGLSAKASHHELSLHLSPGFLIQCTKTYLQGITTMSSAIAIRKPCVRSAEPPAARMGRYTMNIQK